METYLEVGEYDGQDKDNFNMVCIDCDSGGAEFCSVAGCSYAGRLAIAGGINTLKFCDQKIRAN